MALSPESLRTSTEHETRPAESADVREVTTRPDHINLSVYKPHDSDTDVRIPGTLDSGPPESGSLESAPSESGSLESAPSESGSLESAPSESNTPAPNTLLVAPPEPGTLLADRYRLLQVLGRGATGVVYEALDEGPLHRRVAVKLLHAPPQEPREAPHPHASRMQEAAHRRFLGEIQVAGELHHPHIVTVYDAGLWQGRLYMVQALMPGRDLSHVLSSGPPSLERALLLAAQLCDAVATLHRQQILHLDIKPGNILLDQEDNLKLGDFDLARVLRNGVVYPDAPRVGTPGYMSPEQILGQPLDVRTDVFSLGCVLYLLLTGRSAFSSRSREELYALTLRGTPQPPSMWRPDLPPDLDRVLLRALAPDPDQRYASASELARELQHHAVYSQLLSLPQARKLLAPVQSSGAVTLVLGTALPCAPHDVELPNLLAQAHGQALTHGQTHGQTQAHGQTHGQTQAHGQTLTHWLTHALRAQAPDLAQEPETSRLPPDVAACLKQLQRQSLERGADAVRSSLATVLGELAPEPWLRTLVQLRPRLILTTRQDDGLAQAFAAAGLPVCRGFLTEPLPELEPGTVLIIHLLGNLTRPESLLLEEDDLWSQLRALETPGSPLVEEVRSRLASTLLLYVGLDDAPLWQRRVADLLALDRMGNPPHGILCQAHISLETLHWSTRRGLAAIEHDPLRWLEQVAQEVGKLTPLETSLPLPSRPYKRLDPFNPEDEPIFFGRERELQRLSGLLLARPTTMLFGPSGSGKSSLIHAGLVPRLQRSGVDVLVIRPLAPPEEELRQALQPYRESLDEGDLSHSLPGDLLTQVARQTRLLVVVVDQAEELFVRHPAETRQALAGLVSRALSASQGRLRWLWSLREDFLPRMAELQAQLPTLFHNTFQLLPLTPRQARPAITEPARKLGLEVEEALADQLLTELCTERVEPPQLQLVCDTLYEALEGSLHRMTLRQLEQLGGVAGILGGYLERMIQNLPEHERPEIKEVLLALVSPEGTRLPSRLEELASRTRLTPTRVQELLEKLLQLRLLRLIAREEGDWFELTHEYLTREILVWQDEVMRELRRLRSLLETGTRNHRLHGLLLPSEQLKLLSRNLERLNPTDEERALLRQSEGALRRTRTERVGWTLLTLLLLLVMGLGGRYFQLSRSQFMRLETQTLAGVRWDEHETQPLHALRLYRGSPRPSAVDNVLGFPKLLETRSLPLESLTSQGQTLLPEGLELPTLTDIPHQLAPYQPPDLSVREHILSDHWTEAVAETLSLLRSNQLDPDASLRLLPLMAISGPPNRSVVEAALDHAERTELSRGLVAGTATSEREPITSPYTLLLDQSPRAWWQERLNAWVQRRETRFLGLRLLAAVGDDRDAPVVTPWLNDRVAMSDAGVALADMNACSFVPTMLTPPPPAACVEYPGVCTKLLSACGTTGRIPETQDLLVRLLRHPATILSTDSTPELFRALRVRGHQALGTVARQWFALGFKVQEVPAGLGRLASAADESARDFLRHAMETTTGNAQFQSALRLARHGEVAAVPYLWHALPPRTDKSSFSALWALGQFEGPALYERLLTLTARTPDGKRFSHPLMQSPHARAGIFYALLPYHTPEVQHILLSGLADPDIAVATDAASCLVRFVERHERPDVNPTSPARPGVREQLQALSQTGEPLIRLKALRLLQTLGRQPNLTAFRLELERAAATLPLYYEAMGGLREGLTLSSFDVVLQMMDARQADVRRAAVLAAGQPPHVARTLATTATPDWGEQKRRSLQQARWLASVLNRQKSALPVAEEWLKAGQTQLFKRWVESLQLAPGDWGQVMQQVLDLTVEEAEQLTLWSRPMEAELQLRRGELDWAVHRFYFATSDQPEKLRQQVLASRPLPELEQYIRYQQVMDLVPPRRLPPDLNWNIP